MALPIRIFFSNTATTTDIYTLSLHDALPILFVVRRPAAEDDGVDVQTAQRQQEDDADVEARGDDRSEEHTSELQSLRHLVCRLLLEKKKIYAVEPLARPRPNR